MFKFIKGLFVSEPEATAPENLVLFTPNDGSWDTKQVRRLYDAGLGRLHVQVRKDWDRRHYEQFLRAIPEAFWPRIVLGEEPELVEANKLGGFQMHPGERVPRRWPKHAAVSAKCHDYDELRSTDKACGYVFLTPIFESVSKKDHRPRRTLREYEVILQRWKAEGGATEAGPARARDAGDFTARPPLAIALDTQAVAARLQQGRLSVIDARAGARVRGEGAPLDPRGGHNPGARHLHVSGVFPALSASTLAATRDVVVEDMAMSRLQQIGFASGGKTFQQFGQNEPLLRLFTRAYEAYLAGGGLTPAPLRAEAAE